MKFEPLPTVVPNMRLWGAARGSLTFVISIDDKYDGRIRASVKVRGAKPFDTGRHDLGIFESFTAAEQACREFKAN
jgi:hypothetical protein